MSRNVKNNLEKKIDVELVINNILKSSKLRLDQFLAETSISLDAIRKSIERGSLSKASVERILDKFDINEDALTEGKELIYSGRKPTHDENGAAVPQKDLGDTWEAMAFRKIIEGDAEYVLVHKTAFENHRFTSLEQIEAQAKELAAARAEVERLVNKFIDFVKDTKGLGSIPELPKIKETKKDTTV
jgi:hypothetical protein